MAFTDDEHQIALGMAMGVAAVWSMLPEVVQTAIIAQASMQAAGSSLPETKKEVLAFVEAHGGNKDA